MAAHLLQENERLTNSLADMRLSSARAPRSVTPATTVSAVSSPSLQQLAAQPLPAATPTPTPSLQPLSPSMPRMMSVVSSESVTSTTDLSPVGRPPPPVPAAVRRISSDSLAQTPPLLSSRRRCRCLPWLCRLFAVRAVVPRCGVVLMTQRAKRSVPSAATRSTPPPSYVKSPTESKSSPAGTAAAAAKATAAAAAADVSFEVDQGRVVGTLLYCPALIVC